MMTAMMHSRRCLWASCACLFIGAASQLLLVSAQQSQQHSSSANSDLQNEGFDLSGPGEVINYYYDGEERNAFRGSRPAASQTNRRQAGSISSSGPSGGSDFGETTAASASRRVVKLQPHETSEQKYTWSTSPASDSDSSERRRNYNSENGRNENGRVSASASSAPFNLASGSEERRSQFETEVDHTSQYDPKPDAKHRANGGRDGNEPAEVNTPKSRRYFYKIHLDDKSNAVKAISLEHKTAEDPFLVNEQTYLTPETFGKIEESKKIFSEILHHHIPPPPSQENADKQQHQQSGNQRVDNDSHEDDVEHTFRGVRGDYEGSRFRKLKNAPNRQLSYGAHKSESKAIARPSFNGYYHAPAPLRTISSPIRESSSRDSANDARRDLNDIHNSNHHHHGSGSSSGGGHHYNEAASTSFSFEDLPKKMDDPDIPPPPPPPRAASPSRDNRPRDESRGGSGPTHAYSGPGPRPRPPMLSPVQAAASQRARLRSTRGNERNGNGMTSAYIQG